MEPASDRRSLASLFGELGRETLALARQQVALARAEISEKISQIGKGLASLGIGGVIVLVGLFFLVQALVFGVGALLDNWMGGQIVVWLAPLLAGLVAALIGGVILVRALRSLWNINPVPSRTAASLRRDTNLVREHVR